MSQEKHAQFEVSQGAVIENAIGQILILKLRGGGWVVPGGHLQANEDWFDGLCREIREETGIENIKVVGFVNISVFKSCYGVCFHCRVPDDKITVLLSDEHDDYAWVSSTTEAAKYSFHHPVIRDCVMRVFEHRFV